MTINIEKFRKEHRDFHYCRYEHPDRGTELGVARLYASDQDEQVIAAAAQDKLVMDCMITPQAIAVPVDHLSPVKYTFNCEFKGKLATLAKQVGMRSWGMTIEQDYRGLHNLRRTVLENSNTSDSLQVNDQFSIGVADGSADYVVTRIARSTCDVEWFGANNPDRYLDHHYGWGGTFRIYDVSRYVGRLSGVSELFGKPNEQITAPNLKKLIVQFNKNYKADLRLDL